MKKLSAGLVVYRIRDDQLEILLAHMGSPWWARKDKGAWSIPKGEYVEPEEPLAAAKREFKEELNLDVPAGEPIPLGSIEQSNNKSVMAWALEADLDLSNVKSNTFEMEWPPKSGRLQEFPEIDRAEYKPVAEASEKCVPGQAELFKRLSEKLGLEVARPEQGSLF